MKNQCLLVLDVKLKFNIHCRSSQTQHSEVLGAPGAWAHPVASFASRQMFAQALTSPGSDGLCILAPFYTSRSFALEIFLAKEAFMQHVGHVITVQNIFLFIPFPLCFL